MCADDFILLDERIRAAKSLQGLHQVKMLRHDVAPNPNYYVHGDLMTHNTPRRMEFEPASNRANGPQGKAKAKANAKAAADAIRTRPLAAPAADGVDMEAFKKLTHQCIREFVSEKEKELNKPRGQQPKGKAKPKGNARPKSSGKSPK